MARRHSGRKGIQTVSFLLFLVITISSGGTLLNAAPGIRYEVSVPDPASEHFHVKAYFEGFDLDTLQIMMPVWAPGAYDVVNFGDYVRDITAVSGVGSDLPVTKVESGSWVVANPSRNLVVSYRVDDIEELDNSPWFGLSDIELETKIAFANTSALFVYLEGYQDLPVEVTYTPPPGWKIAVALDKVGESSGAYRYTAPNYDELVDAPVQMGDFQRWDFEVRGVPHAMTITAPVPIDEETAAALIERTTKIITVIADFFGEIPYDQYLFQFYLVRPTRSSQGFGALEHKRSSTYKMPYTPPSRLVGSLQAVIAHEYWHIWSPKLFHVRTLGPFDYRTPPRTTSLWFHEGLTEYYAHALMVRNGLITPKSFSIDFGGRLNSLAGGEQGESIAALSADLPFRNISEVYPLYVKGPVLGLLLDISIREQTGNRKSLDDAMKVFNEKFGDHRGGESFGDDDIVPFIEEVTGASVQPFFDAYIAGTETPPLEEMLAAAALRPVIVPEFGVFLHAEKEGWLIRYIYPGYSADKSGLIGGDIIVGIGLDGEDPVPVAELPFRPMEMNDFLIDEDRPEIVMKVVRGDKTLLVPLVVQNRISTLEVVPDASPESIAIRKSLFSF